MFKVCMHSSLAIAWRPLGLRTEQHVPFSSQAPDSLTSFSMAIQLLTVALGSYLSSALVAIMGAITGTPGWLPPAGYSVNQGHMDYFFYMLGVLQIIGLIIHIPVAMVRCCTLRRRMQHVSPRVCCCSGTSPRRWLRCRVHTTWNEWMTRTRHWERLKCLHAPKTRLLMLSFGMKCCMTQR